MQPHHPPFLLSPRTPLEAMTVSGFVRIQTNPGETLAHVYSEVFNQSKCHLPRQRIRFRASLNRSSCGASPRIRSS